MRKKDAMIDTMRRQTYSEPVRNCLGLHHTFRFTVNLPNPCLDTYFRTFLIHASQPKGHPLPAGTQKKCLVYLADHFSPDWLPDWGKKTSALYIFWMPIHFLLAQSTWFISAVPCLHKCLTCFEVPNKLVCQRSICNKDLYLGLCVCSSTISLSLSFLPVHVWFLCSMAYQPFWVI